MADDVPIRCFAWGIAPQQSLLQAAGTVEGFSVTLAGCPEIEDGITLASSLGAEAVTDLRTALLRDDWDVAWLTAPGSLDSTVRRTIRDLDRPVATSTPPVDSIQDLMNEPEDGPRARFIPLMRLGRPFRGAEQALESFGAKHSAHIEMIAGQEGMTSASMLYDAMDLTFGLLGMPDNLFAARAGGETSVRNDKLPIDGHIVVSLRYPNRCAAAVSIAQGGGQWSRRVVVLGEGGRLIVSDDGVEWISGEGEVLDAGRGQTTDLPAAGEVAAHHLKRIATNREPLDELDTSFETICLCEAVRLSCATGQAEDPGRIARMFRRS